MPLVTALLAVMTFALLAVRMRKRLAPAEVPQRNVGPDDNPEWDARLDEELALLD